MSWRREVYGHCHTFCLSHTGCHHTVCPTACHTGCDCRIFCYNPTVRHTGHHSVTLSQYCCLTCFLCSLKLSVIIPRSDELFIYFRKFRPYIYNHILDTCSTSWGASSARVCNTFVFSLTFFILQYLYKLGQALWARSNFGLWYAAIGVVKMLHTDKKLNTEPL